MIFDVTEEPEDDRPFLLLDVDGVINTINASQNAKTYKIFKVGPFTIRIRHEMKGWLARLGEHYQLVWATMWDDAANDDLAPVLGLPDLPYIPCHHTAYDDPEWRGQRIHPKIPVVEYAMKDHPFAFVDDGFGKGDMAWAKERDDEIAPTKFLYIDPRMGLLKHHIDKLIAWADLIK